MRDEARSYATAIVISHFLNSAQLHGCAMGEAPAPNPRAQSTNGRISSMFYFNPRVNSGQELWRFDSAGGFGAAEEFVDVAAVLLGAVEDEHEFGGAAELEAFAELMADETGGGGEGLHG